MNAAVLATCLLIVVARVADITLDTIRTVAIIQGRRAFAAILGFFEAVIYIFAVAKVLQNFTHPAYAIAYGLGFAAGTYLGITIEQLLAFGEQLVAVITRKGEFLATALRSAGYQLTTLQGQGRDGQVNVLYIEVSRSKTRTLIEHTRQLDEDCFYVVNDVRLASELRGRRRRLAPTTLLSHAERGGSRSRA